MLRQADQSVSAITLLCKRDSVDPVCAVINGDHMLHVWDHIYAGNVQIVI